MARMNLNATSHNEGWDEKVIQKMVLIGGQYYVTV